MNETIQIEMEFFLIDNQLEAVFCSKILKYVQYFHSDKYSNYFIFFKKLTLKAKKLIMINLKNLPFFNIVSFPESIFIYNIPFDFSLPDNIY
jgi:hypothetical protein